MAQAALANDNYMYSTAPEVAMPMPDTVSVARPASRPVAIPRPVHRARISAFGVLGYLFIACLFVACLISNVELTRISVEITGVRAVPPRIQAQVGISQRLAALTEQNNALRIEYERVFDLKEIERYATQELGMVQVLEPNMTRSVAGSAADKAVIPSDIRKTESVADVVSSILAYFK